MSRIKSLLTTDAFKTLYYSLIFPYIQYCILAWGTAGKTVLNPLVVIQKRTVRMMSNVGRLDHTHLLFRNLDILKLNDVHKHEVIKFIHNEISNPVIFDFIQVGQIHGHNTRRRNDLRPPRYKSRLSKRFITYHGCKIWNDTPQTIRNIVNKTTLKIRSKKYMLNLY